MCPEPLLAGVRVVEVGQYIAAPLAATLFADHGAEVVKIERPGGDPYRRDPARFAAWNRGKTSEVIDLSAAEGRARAMDLIAEADVLMENLRPGAMAGLGLPPDELRRRHRRLVTCSISAYGSSGPACHEPGWEPLVHARAGAQQGLFTGDQPMWLPFPMASVAAGLLAVLGIGAALVKRESTGYGQHVETSLFEALLFLNAGPIFRREGRRPKVVRSSRSPILRVFETRDGGGVMVNLSGTERWRELCRLVELDDDGGLDYSTREGLAKLSDREWSAGMLQELVARFASRTADEWEQALLAAPAAAAKCNTLEEWLAHEQVAANGLLADTVVPSLGTFRLVAPPLRVQAQARGQVAPRRHGSEQGALAGHRVIDLSSFWAGPLAARLLAELGADVVKVEPPGGEGSFQLMPVLPNIYVDANRSKRGLTLELRTDVDRHRLLDLVAAADVVVENAVVGTWERLGLGEAELRAVNPNLIYARAKGFGLHGPLAPRPSFDYVVQAATGMEMTQGGGRPQPVNFTANDYCTGIHLAAGMVLALLARARGTGSATVEASLMMTATFFQSEDIAQLALHGRRDDNVGTDLLGPSPSCHLYQALDGWCAVVAPTAAQRLGLLEALDLTELSSEEVSRAIATMTVATVGERLAAHGVPTTPSVHTGSIPDDEQVRHGAFLATVGHPEAGRFLQVAIPLHLSVDGPAIRGPAPSPRRIRRELVPS